MIGPELNWSSLASWVQWVYYEYLDILTVYDMNIPPIKSSNAELNPICHLLALLGAHHILHVSRIRVKEFPRLFLTKQYYFH